MRPVNKGSVPLDPKTAQPKQYPNYKDAKPDLIDRLGEYCSFCERRMATGLAVEHVQAKDPHCRPDLERDWDNFLLACVNCNSTKRTKVCDEADTTKYYWAHLDNTFRVFIYEATGDIKVNPDLTTQEPAKAQRTIKLTGIDREDRQKQREEAWGIANDAKHDLQRGSSPRTVITLAQQTGFWSVWMTVFQDDSTMLKELIKAFPGTCDHCFDPAGRPIARQGGIL